MSFYKVGYAAAGIYMLLTNTLSFKNLCLQELNRLKRAALCLGFYELLDGVASIFERESVTMPPTLHPDCSRQLKHAANELRSRAAMSVDYVISPRH